MVNEAYSIRLGRGSQVKDVNVMMDFHSAY